MDPFCVLTSSYQTNGRFLALIALGGITGVNAAQKSSHNFAALHIFFNTISTIAGFFAGIF
jgi:hypothetical protein